MLRCHFLRVELELELQERCLMSHKTTCEAPREDAEHPENLKGSQRLSSEPPTGPQDWNDVILQARG